MSVGGASALERARAPAQPDLAHYYSYAPSPDQELFDDILPVADSFALDLAHLDASHPVNHINTANNNASLPNTYNGSDLFADFRLDDFLVSHHDAFDLPHTPSFLLEERGPATTDGQQPPFGASLDGCDDGRNAVAV